MNKKTVTLLINIVTEIEFRYLILSVTRPNRGLNQIMMRIAHNEISETSPLVNPFETTIKGRNDDVMNSTNAKSSWKA
jgi:hypothetical protein